MRCISCELWSYQSPIWNCSTFFCEISPAISVHILESPTYVCKRLECVDWFDEHVLGRRRITWMNYEAWMIGLPILTSVSANQKKGLYRWSIIKHVKYLYNSHSNNCILPGQWICATFWGDFRSCLCFFCSSCQECRSRKRCPHVCVFRGIGEKHPRDWLLLFADPISYTFGRLKLRFRTDSKIPCSSNLWLLSILELR